jgi:uncharacterized 2Fe-2S/4Fe-4S cluster protein (DUF4445 family)
MKINFKPLNYEADVEPDTSILDAALKAGAHIETECGGMGRCGKCKVRVHKGVTPVTPLEREYLSRSEVRSGVRLACQARVTAPTIVHLISIPTGSDQILEEGIFHSVRFEPGVRKYYLDIKREDLKGHRSISEILEGFLRAQGASSPRIDLKTLKILPSLLSKTESGITAVVGGDEILGIEPGDTKSNVYGLAVDIGTTTVVGYLFDLGNGKLIGVDSALNGQYVHGSDVISRIDYAINQPNGLDQLQAEVTETINGIIENLCRSCGISNKHIYKLTVVGNTTMSHLFLGISPRFLSRYPYNPVTVEALDISAADFDVDINPAGRVGVLPVVSGFIGSDTVGVILSTGLHKSKAPKLAIDIGTNGEIVLTDGSRMVACSCAAGPAFEGAHIQCGMRGAAGAIDRVDCGQSEISYHVIGETAPTGICGSGLLDAVAGMLQAGIIRRDGALLRPDAIQNPLYRARVKCDKYTCFVLAGGEDTDRTISVTQKDVREVQLAKGAMLAGIGIIMRHLGLVPDDIKEVYLAGAFGNYIRPESAIAVGLLPPFRNARITQVGNAAGSGAKMALLSLHALREAARIAQRVEYLDLAKIPDFNQEFIKGMAFPL